MYRHILIPTDGYPLSLEAIAHGVELARETGAGVSVCPSRAAQRPALPCSGSSPMSAPDAATWWSSTRSTG
jgi:nucleotide-binding universal stress UspA family protein